MDHSLLLLGIGVLAIMTGVSAHSAYDSCTAPHDCPGSTTCRCNGPSGYECRCADGYTIDEDRGGHECIKAVKLLEPCDSLTNKCVPTTTLCNVDSGQCECLPGYRLSETNSTCVQEGLRTIRESCNTDDECELLTACSPTEKVCICMLGFRLKTQEEYDANPDEPFHCVPGSFDLNSSESCPETTTLPVPTTSPQSPTATTTSPQSPTAASTATTTQPITALSSTTATTSTPTSGTKLFESCSDDSECPGSAACSAHGCGGNVCLCFEGFMASSDNNTCVKKSLIGEDCAATSDCLPFMSYCRSGVCECSWLMRETKGHRPLCTYTRYLLGEYAPPGSMCQDANAAPVLDRTCQCKTGFRPKTDREFWVDPRDIVECVSDSIDSCLPTGTGPTTPPSTPAPPATVPPRNRLILDMCTHDGECPVNSMCQQRNCGVSLCVCSVRFVSSPDRSSCIPGKLIDEGCSQSGECFPTLSFCDGTCKCHGYALQTRRQTCIRWTYFLKKALGGECGSPFNCLGTATDCIGGRCACGMGYREKTTEEMWGNPADERECVPIGFTLGCPA